ncbi:UpxY family transcription antiterminator [Daejeonella oryzae]|uniref:UpxY family transcription antiterminator n=1 Tax=Daejeonella oryzae TaxID=1122943 RepID=UPI00042A00E0|nr:UpxY family transcription antiterminator [Daejeonella oryzae]
MEALKTIRSAKAKKWMVIYTRARWEKKVEQVLIENHFEAYCPVKRVEKQWADRKKVVDIPLFTSYVFVRLSPVEEFKVRQVYGVINFIYYQNKPAIIRDAVLEDIRKYLDICPDMETVGLQELASGDRVRIKDGIFCDKHGEVLKVEGKNIVMVIEHLGCVLLTKVNVNNISIIN